MMYGNPGEEEAKYSPQAVIDHAFLHHTLDAHNIKREDIGIIFFFFENKYFIPCFV